MSYNSVENQLPMALDGIRNQAYLNALEKIITPESVVLDLGAGLGTLGLLAAKLGAKHVHFVEPEAVIKLIPKIAKDNNLTDRITCYRGKIEDVTLPEKVDVIISVFTGNFLLEEGLLPSLYYARDKYLKPGGVLLPSAGEMWLAPVSHAPYYQRQVDRTSKPHHGLNISALNQYPRNTVARSHGLNKDHYLSEPVCLKRIDFMSSSISHANDSVDALITKKAHCHGFVGWFNMNLNSQILSTAPHAARTHWSSLFFPCETPMDVREADSLTISVKKKPGISWTWSFKLRGTTQRLSELRTWLEIKSMK